MFAAGVPGFKDFALLQRMRKETWQGFAVCVPTVAGHLRSSTTLGGSPVSYWELFAIHLLESYAKEIVSNNSNNNKPPTPRRSNYANMMLAHICSFIMYYNFSHIFLIGLSGVHIFLLVSKIHSSYAWSLTKGDRFSLGFSLFAL